MEYVILGAVLVAFASISGQLSSIKNKLDNKPKTKINLKELVGKKVKVYLDDDYDIELEGELVSFDKKWFEILLKVRAKPRNNEESRHKERNVYPLPTSHPRKGAVWDFGNTKGFQINM